MSEKNKNHSPEEQRQEELSDAELTDVAGGAESFSLNFEKIKFDSNSTTEEGGEGFDFVQVNGSN